MTTGVAGSFGSLPPLLLLPHGSPPPLLLLFIQSPLPHPYRLRLLINGSSVLHLPELKMLSRIVRPVGRSVAGAVRMFSAAPSFDPYNPTEEHSALREMVRQFTEQEVDPQALEYNREEKFNRRRR